MKTTIKFLTITILILFLVYPTYAQKKLLKQSIYFESAKYELNKEAKMSLDILLDSLKNFQSYKIFISGNTDDVGDSIYNKSLSEQRVNSTKDYLIAHAVLKTAFKTAALGERKPIADNLTDQGKQKNRRVDISISFVRKVPIDSSQIFPSVCEIYKLIEIKPQEFCINPTRDTVIRCSKGTLVYVKANSFKISKTCKTEYLTIKVKEDFLKSEMILDNLSTTSNGQLLETQGMVYTEANDCNGNTLNLLKAKDLVVFVPTDSFVPETKILFGSRTLHDSIMNWTVSNTSVLGNFTINELNICSDWIYWSDGFGGYSNGCGECNFFFCRIGRIGVSIKGITNKQTHFSNIRFRKCLQQLKVEQNKERKGKANKPVARSKGNLNKPIPRSAVVTQRPEIVPELMPRCKKLEELYRKYGVNNLIALTEAINKPIMDSLGVKTLQELKDTMTKISISKFELSYLNKRISYDDFKYYVYNTSRLGWSNIDVFAKLPKDSLVDMKIKLKFEPNIDCKLVFVNRRFVIPADKTGAKYVFKNLPRGEKVWIIALKFDEGKPYLSMQETTIENKTYPIDFKLLTLTELKEELKKLDR